MRERFMTFDFEKFSRITASVYPQSIYTLQGALAVFNYYFEQYEHREAASAYQSKSDRADMPGYHRIAKNQE